MNYRIAYDRAVNVTASGLAMVAQRLPLVKNLTPIFGELEEVILRRHWR